MIAGGILRSGARSRTARAFTLIELMAVMVILAILAALIVPSYTGRIASSKIKAAQSDISSIKTALSMFEIENGRFPTTAEGLDALIQNPGNLPDWKRDLDKNNLNDPWGTKYIYRCPGTNGKDYDLLSAGPDKQEGTADDIKDE